MQLDNGIYDLILKNGILKYKYKNSKFQDCSNVENIHKGSIFTFRKKEDLKQGRGLILTSLEALEDNQKQISHWTPNIFRYAEYMDKNKRIVQGHSEDNLKQINTFFIDIDHSKINEHDILNAALELKFLPTAILRTDRGYQVYFVLETPVYVSKKTNFKVVDTAKIISKNLRAYFHKEGFNVDLFCNHFGIARFPNKKNVVYYDKNNVYPFVEWIDWSIRQSDDYYQTTNKKFYVLKGSKNISQVNEKWFSLLLNSNHVEGKKEVLGRNNVLFTLSLACYSSGISQKDAENKLRVFNDNLENKLEEKEYLRIIESAYSKKYNAANNEYILELCKNWVREDIKKEELFTNQKWFKFKKERKNRERTHFEEWEKDVLDYIASNDKVYLEMKKKYLIDVLNIPKRSLDIVLKSLEEKRLIFYKSTVGRLGGIKIALLRKVYIHILTLKKQAKERYLNNLAKFLEENVSYIHIFLKKYEENLYLSNEYDLFEEDVGRIVFI